MERQIRISGSLETARCRGLSGSHLSLGTPEKTGAAADRCSTKSSLGKCLCCSSPTPPKWIMSCRCWRKTGKLEPFRAALKKMVVASIGPTASERLRHYEWPIDLEPSHAKMGVLVKETSEQAHALLQPETISVGWFVLAWCSARSACCRSNRCYGSSAGLLSQAHGDSCTA